jgi:Ran GTPase-activating protein (RanGAP) involved in mRNA processing and transport
MFSAQIMRDRYMAGAPDSTAALTDSHAKIAIVKMQENIIAHAAEPLVMATRDHHKRADDGRRALIATSTGSP